ncbi:MAG TPA: hypothetical protein GX012_04505 [Acholeplasma sp.]|nr:hypothetical protein [Acholeplasma sp.]
MQRTKYWHRLDNAAKVFPAISKNNRSNVFRFSMYLKENINIDILNEAVNIVLDRTEAFNIQLKNGFFWNYFSENKNYYLVEPEPSVVCKHFKFSQNQGFLFKVYYLNNKITLETFHALSDGTGALEFLKSIVYEYLTLMGNVIDHENLILSRQPFSNKENIDSFYDNYQPKNKRVLKEEKAYHLTGDTFKDNWTIVFKIQTDINKFLKLVKEKYDVTITQYLTALIAYSIYDEGIDFKNNKKPIKMFIPVNLRPYFNSKSLRNFSLFIKATYKSRRDWTFVEMLETTKEQFVDQLVKDKLNQRINSLVGLERNIFIRFTPLFIKNIFFKLGYQMLGESINTSSISNIGKIILPKEMEAHVIDVEFINTGHGINTAVSTYLDLLNITFNTNIKDLSIIRTFIKQLREDNIDILVDTNYKDDYNELL